MVDGQEDQLNGPTATPTVVLHNHQIVVAREHHQALTAQ